MFNKIKSVWNWLKKQWNRFDGWVARRIPGFKTWLVALLGFVSSAAAVAQEFISGLPLEQFINAKTIAFINIALFTLVFWFKGMSRRNHVV